MVSGETGVVGTAEERGGYFYVQGRPCVGCGAITNRQVAAHIDPLVVQYYRDGAVDSQSQRSLEAVQPHCPRCSVVQGGQLGAFGKAMRKYFGF